MTNRLIVFALGLVVAFSAFPQRAFDVASGCVDRLCNSAEVSRTLEALPDGYRITYNFHRVILQPDPEFPGCESGLLDGFTQVGLDSEPAYPYSSDSFLIPSHCTFSVSEPEIEWVYLESTPSPSRPFLLSDQEDALVSITPVKEFKGWFPTSSVITNP